MTAIGGHDPAAERVDPPTERADVGAIDPDTPAPLAPRFQDRVDQGGPIRVRAHGRPSRFIRTVSRYLPTRSFGSSRRRYSMTTSGTPESSVSMHAWPKDQTRTTSPWPFS